MLGRRIASRARSLAPLRRGFGTDAFSSTVSILRRRNPAYSLAVLGSHPDPNVCGTIPKGHAVAGLEFPQQTDGVAVGEDEVSEVQHDRGSGGECVERCAQLPDASSVESTADVQDDRGAVAYAADHEHW